MENASQTPESPGVLLEQIEAEVLIGPEEMDGALVVDNLYKLHEQMTTEGWEPGERLRLSLTVWRNYPPIREAVMGPVIEILDAHTVQANRADLEKHLAVGRFLTMDEDPKFEPLFSRLQIYLDTLDAEDAAQWIRDQRDRRAGSVDAASTTESTSPVSAGSESVLAELDAALASQRAAEHKGKSEDDEQLTTEEILRRAGIEQRDRVYETARPVDTLAEATDGEIVMIKSGDRYNIYKVSVEDYGGSKTIILTNIDTGEITPALRGQKDFRVIEAPKPSPPEAGRKPVGKSEEERRIEALFEELRTFDSNIYEKRYREIRRELARILPDQPEGVVDTFFTEIDNWEQRLNLLDLGSGEFTAFESSTEIVERYNTLFSQEGVSEPLRQAYANYRDFILQFRPSENWDTWVDTNSDLIKRFHELDRVFISACSEEAGVTDEYNKASAAQKVYSAILDKLENLASLSQTELARAYRDCTENELRWIHIRGPAERVERNFMVELARKVGLRFEYKQEPVGVEFDEEGFTTLEGSPHLVPGDQPPPENGGGQPLKPSPDAPPAAEREETLAELQELAKTDPSRVAEVLQIWLAEDKRGGR